MSKKRYEYDVALSYAGENERFVKQVYRHLAAADIKVFFAPRRTGHLWGKDQQEFERVYGPASRFVVPFLSEHYATKEWPQLEFRAARKEARTRSGEFILPVRLDSTTVPGLSPKLQYVDGQRVTPKEIARMLIEEKIGIVADPRRQTALFARRSNRVHLVSAEDAEILRLVATATFPLRRDAMQRLVPGVNWSSAVTRWRRRGLLKQGKGHIEVTADIRRQLFVAPDTEQKTHERWIELLLPLREHGDVALSLGLHYLALRRIQEMLDALIPIAEGLEPGFWNDLYLSVFARLQTTPHLRNADPQARVLFHNSYALLLTRNERHRDALAQFAKLRALSRRTKNAWGEGQSYINAGVAAAHAGNDRAARVWYEKAIAHARRHGDKWLLGRALGNLAHFTDTETATKLLDESERLKTRVGDVSGLAGTLMARGNLAAASGDFASAGRFYRRAESIGRRLDKRYLQVMALRNIGTTEVDRGRPTKGVPFYRKALQIAEKERFADQLPHILVGEAIAHAEARQYRRAEKVFERLVTVHNQRGDHTSAVVALHDVGAMQVMQKRRSDAYKTLSAVIDQAKRRRATEWVYRTKIDAASVAPSDRTAVALLRAARPAALRAKDIERALFCTVTLAEWHLHNHDVEAALREITTAIRLAPADARLDFLADQLSLLIEARASDRRIGSAFRQLLKAADVAGDQERLVDAHMALGDALWSRGTADERANAYQAFVAALPPAIRISFETFLRVGVHASTTLHTLFRDEDCLQVLDDIERKTGKWLRAQKVLQKHHDLALWPLRLARRVLERDDLGRDVSGTEMMAMLTEEVERGTGLSLRKGKRPTLSTKT